MTYVTYHRILRHWMVIGALLIASTLTFCHPAPAQTYDGAYGTGAPQTYPKDEELNTTQDLYTVTGSDKDDPPLSLRFVERGPSHYADIVFYNTLVHGFYTHRQVNFVRPDGKVTSVYFAMEAGEEPDVMTVIPPQGYIAIPQDIVVPEYSEGVIEIHEYIGG